MDVEAIQLLNLSPIPELSELELSTMMDQLSGLSDINGDLTDQHVENIIKEAEDLIDKSSCNKKSESNSSKTLELDLNQSKNEKTEDSEFEIQDLQPAHSKHFNTPVSSNHFINDVCDRGDADRCCGSPIERIDASRHCNSPVEQTSMKVYSPCGSCNHIKSTIDSLKEFSSMIEQQLSNRSPTLSPKYSKLLTNNNKCGQNYEIKVLDSKGNEKSNNSRLMQPKGVISKKNSMEVNDKSVKLLNCFERLYQSRPVRLLACKKTKPIEKLPKPLTKKKLTKDIKSSFKSSKKKSSGDMNPVSENIYENTNYKFTRNSVNFDILEVDKSPSGYSSLCDFKCVSNFKTKSKSTNELVLQNQGDYSTRDNRDSQSALQPKIDENLILKVLEEVKEIKSQVRKAGFCGDSPERPPEDQAAIDSLKSEVESVRDKVTSVSNAGIKRLQEQFSLLKFKYYQQMDKLEAENLKLREALHSQQKFFAARKNASNNVSTDSETCFLTETRNYKISISSSPSSCEAKTAEDASEKGLVTTESREAFCQTERQTTSAGVQCCLEAPKEPETRKTENKENLSLKCRLGRSKPFSDVGVQQLTRQKKLLDHESQLLATLRGLQSEMTAKDKENRKLKTEMESLKKQIKKLANSRADNVRRSHVGTQTIGLGPPVQKAYTPETYEARKEFEKENEDLKARIRALEEDFEMLKEKRINDLQALHQVHEEEIAKLVSKLETQSSLTKHLHSLLINR